MKSQLQHWWKIDHFLLCQVCYPAIFLDLPFKMSPAQKPACPWVDSLTGFKKTECLDLEQWEQGGSGGSSEKCPLSSDPQSYLVCVDILKHRPVEAINTVAMSWPNTANPWPVLGGKNNKYKRKWSKTRSSDNAYYGGTPSLSLHTECSWPGIIYLPLNKGSHNLLS